MTDQLPRLCTDCSTPLADGARYCSQCGTAAPVEAAEPETPAPSEPDWTALVGSDAARDDRLGGAPLPSPAGETEEAVTADLAEADPAEAADVEAAPLPSPDSARPMWPLLAGAVAIALIAGLWLGWSLIQGWPQDRAKLGEEEKAAPFDGRPEWQRVYVDSLLPEPPARLVINGRVNIRDFPDTRDTQVLRTLDEGTEVTGQWVQGRDSRRWLRVDGGGYVREDGVVAPGGPDSPIAIPFSNRDSSFGPDIRPYLDEASARSRARYAAIDALTPDLREKELARLEETSSVHVRVPNRRFHGLTVTAVALHYEASGIIFRESPAAVMRVFRDRGVRIDADGSVPLPGSEAESCSFSSTADWPETASYGATQLICGV